MTPIVIVAHISRERRAERLANAINAEAVMLDDGSLGPGRNHLQAWQWLAESDEEWSVVLEDDAKPIKPFREQLDKVLQKAPGDVVSLYLGRGRPPHWQPSIARVITSSAHFLRTPELLHHVGVAVRTNRLPDMTRYLSTRNFDKVPIDEAIGQWVRNRHMMVCYCRPSIVEHDVKLPTVITTHVSAHKTDTGRRDNPLELRKAWEFGKRLMWKSTVEYIPVPRV